MMKNYIVLEKSVNIRELFREISRFLHIIMLINRVSTRIPLYVSRQSQGMEELTLILFCASLAVGAAVALLKKLSGGAYMMSLTLSVLALGAVVSDEAMLQSSNTELLLAIIAPFIIMLYSLWGMLFGFSKEKD